MRVLGVLRPRKEYSLHLGPRGLKVNCDNEIYYECELESQTQISYNYATVRKMVELSELLGVGALPQGGLVHIGPMVLCAEVGDLDELEPPPEPNSWVTVPTKYLHAALVGAQGEVSLRVGPLRDGWGDTWGFLLTNGDVRLRLPLGTHQGGGCIALAREVAGVVCEYLGVLGTPMVSLVVAEGSAFGVRGRGEGYLRGPMGTLWVPHQ